MCFLGLELGDAVPAAKDDLALSQTSRQRRRDRRSFFCVSTRNSGRKAFWLSGQICEQ